ncbi:hypothetical protein TBLA_0J01130 [Henningerozyma blattae CBS 6284]|uniref:ATP synthase mitochondrial F1 complex assembly factor 2 n=1 Tax=Henningerozyma blattae (strain ATCC 34711 / CBS 6284 / DSM 70876 / NBRC 10599 / NRRL Y-10934 / UCD 77-7) TaxID=1071380 RepID=I2H9Q9_HENB6|nr:hypothetical protein TBLA_0J01130 [Tetrapisispora blattae CBS 6284]CCH63111.1 hypothetical protein TBLA_0J01130 [Tetrapisispora blattae CBS 6284]
MIYIPSRPLLHVFKRQFHNSIPLCQKPLTRSLWKTVSVSPIDGTSQVALQLDGRTVRTPGGLPLEFPDTHTVLASMLQREWQAVTEKATKGKGPGNWKKLQRENLPLTSLVGRCLGLQMSPKDRNAAKKSLIPFIDTDTLVVMSPQNELDGVLRSRQEELYPKFVKLTEDLFSKDFNPEGSAPLRLSILDTETHGIRPHKQSQPVTDAAVNYLDSLTPWNLAVMEHTVVATKSFLCGILLLQSWAPVKDIAELSLLEAICQAERWGSIPESHERERLQLEQSLHCAALVAFG